MRYNTVLFLTLSLLTMASACDILNNDAKPEDEFIRVIDNADASASFYAIDIKQTTDGGFLLLASRYNADNAYAWLTPYLTKTDNAGNILWETEVAAPYVNPVGEIMETGGAYYFACMHETTLETHILQIDMSGSSPQAVATVDVVRYPVAVAQTGDNSFLLQGFDNFARTTTLAKLNTDFSVAASNSYAVNEDAEEMLIEHITKRGKQLPFFNGNSGDYLFFNGLYNYSFSLVFVSAADLSFTGVLNGYRYSGAVSAIAPLSAGSYAFSTFFEGDNFFFPAGTITETAVSSVESLSGTPISKLDFDAKVAAKSMTINGKPMTVFASNTKNNEIALYFFDPGSGKLNFTKEITDKNPVEVMQLIQCIDGSLAITGRTYVNGQFSRVFVAKISQESL